MQKNEEIANWLKNTWTKHRDDWITVAKMMASGEKKQKSTPEILRMVEKKEFPTNGIIREGNTKLEPRIFGRTNKI